MLTPETRARLATIGWSDAIALPDDMPANHVPARVIIQHRNGYVVHDGASEFTVQPAPRASSRKSPRR